MSTTPFSLCFVNHVDGDMGVVVIQHEESWAGHCAVGVLNEVIRSSNK